MLDAEPELGDEIASWQSNDDHLPTVAATIDLTITILLLRSFEHGDGSLPFQLSCNQWISHSSTISSQAGQYGPRSSDHG